MQILRSRYITSLVTLCAVAGVASAPAAYAQVPTRTVTVVASGDTTVREGDPGTAFGAADPLAVDGSDATGRPVHSYLLFDVPALAAGETVVSAALRVVVRNPTVDGPAVWLTAPTWTEATATWNAGRPARTSTTPIGNFAAMPPTGAETAVAGVTGDARVSLELAPDATDGVSFASREALVGGVRPRLVLTVSSEGGGSTPPANPVP